VVEAVGAVGGGPTFLLGPFFLVGPFFLGTSGA